MASNQYNDIAIPQDLSVAVVGRDQSDLEVFKKKLQNILVTMIEDFQRGEDVAKRCQLRNFDVLYILEEPEDMAAFTLIRAVRSGAVAAVFPIVLVLREGHYLKSDEKHFLESYSVTVLHANHADEKKLVASVTTLFEERTRPTSFQMRLEEAKTMLREGMMQEAERAFEAILKERSQNIPAQVGLLDSSVDQPQKYWKRLKALIASDPANYNFKFEMVDRYMREGRAQEASQLLDELVQEMKRQPQVFWLTELGIVCINLRFLAMSAKIAARLSAIAPEADRWKADLLLARTKLAAGARPESKNHLILADRRAPKPMAEIENLWAIHARHEGDFPSAIDRYRKALELAPDDHRIIYNIGLCFEHLGDRSTARDYFERALRLNPQYARAKERLAAIGNG